MKDRSFNDDRFRLRGLLTLGFPLMLMFLLKTCLYFFPLTLSAVSTTDVSSARLTTLVELHPLNSLE